MRGLRFQTDAAEDSTVLESYVVSNGEVIDVSKDLAVVTVRLEVSKGSVQPDPEDGGTKPL